MPRIEAPTLAEHRDRRRAALLAAGRDIALEQGGRAVTMTSVAARAGLSRPAVYEYFPSSDALLATIVVEEMTRWTGEIAEALAAAGTPEQTLRTFVRSSLRYLADGHHRLAAAVIETGPPPECLAALGAMRATLQAPVAQALAALGVPDGPRAAAMVQGVIDAAGRRIESGAEAEAEIDAAEEFVVGGVRAAAGTAPSA